MAPASQNAPKHTRAFPDYKINLLFLNEANDEFQIVPLRDLPRKSWADLEFNDLLNPLESLLLQQFRFKIDGPRMTIWQPKTGLKAGEHRRWAKDHLNTDLDSVDGVTRCERIYNLDEFLKPAEIGKKAVDLVVTGTGRVVLMKDEPANDEEKDEEEDTVAYLTADFKKYTKAVSTSKKTPSVVAKSTNYKANQASDTALLDGRITQDGGNTAAPPIELYHPAFAEYLARCQDNSLTVPPEVVRQVAVLLRELSTVYTSEDERERGARQKLAAVLDVALEKLSNSDRTSSDFTSPQRTPIENISGAPVIVEIKYELGQGGSDPSVQVSFSYARYNCSSEREALLNASSCPSFLIGLAGAWITILGAVITSRTIVQRLSGYEWHGCSRVLDDAHVLAVAKRLYALRLSIADIQRYYRDLTPPPVRDGCVHPRFCPAIYSFTEESGNKVEFTYVRPLERDPASVVFLAKRNDTDEDIVVKFVRRYGADAHRHMALAGYAPRLIGHESLGGGYGDLSIVAMEYIRGETIHDKYGANTALDLEVRRAIEEALEHLNEEGYIMPDLRRANVMVKDGEDLPMKDRIRIIDFDWVCKEGQGFRYPCHLSRDICSRSGAQEYDVITKEHQASMLEKF